MRLIFEKRFTYRWPSRAVTTVQPGPTVLIVKKELGEAAVEAKAARKPTKEENAAGAALSNAEDTLDATSDQGRSAGDVARSDSGAGGPAGDGGAAVVGDRGGPGVPPNPDA